MDKNAANLHDADAALEAEIARLREDEHVKLAKRYNYARDRRKQYLYQLRYPSYSPHSFARHRASVRGAMPRYFISA